MGNDRGKDRGKDRDKERGKDRGKDRGKERVKERRKERVKERVRAVLCMMTGTTRRRTAGGVGWKTSAMGVLLRYPLLVAVPLPL